MQIIGKDFQGWPVYAKTLREILTELGFEEKDGKFSIDANNELLDAYPRLLEDDGMGYGINEEVITEADNEIYDASVYTGAKVFNIFREKVNKEFAEKVNREFEEERAIMMKKIDDLKK